MKQVEERYISLLTDFGFKRIFGTAMNKDLLICFLNSLFNGKQVVKDVSYLNPEHVGDVYTDRRAIFDVYCEGENGEKFIVEMQNAYQTYFKDRALFYSTFPIREQAPKGNEWDFKLNHIYTVALLNFSMNEDAFDKEKIRHHVQLCDTATHKVFYDKLEYIYVEISKFNKTLEELDTLYEKWLYALKNLYKLTQRPKELCDKVFDRLFEEAEIAKFTPQEMREYETSKMAYRDIKNSVDTAKREGKQEGLAEGIEIGREKGMKEGMEKGMEKGRAEGKHAPPAASRTPRCFTVRTTRCGPCILHSSTDRLARTICSTQRSSAARKAPTAAKRGDSMRRSSPRRAPSAASPFRC